jgi:uncharacterized protein (DUF1330 family)
MKKYHAVALGTFAGIGIGVAAMQTLHAQSKPPVYYISEIEVTDIDGYTKNYATKGQTIIKAAGGRYLAVGQKVTAFDGEAPKRVVLQVWDSMEKLQALRDSADYKELRKTGEKYAKFRSFAVEGLPQ